METKKPMHVVVCGAGPAGLLCAINLLRRNVVGSTPRYTVELVDAGEDYGLLDSEGLVKKRSWMIGLAWPGLHAIRRVPNLYDGYVSKVGVEINSLALYLGSRKMLSSSGAAGTDAENYLVDRNHVTAALASYLHEHFKASGCLTLRYHTKLNFVDAEAHRVHVRCNGEDQYLDYNLLVGADGVRSGVRAAFVASHRDFECAVSDIFERFKAVHLDLPEGMEYNCMHVFPSCVPHMNGIGLCESGRRINISMGHRCHAPCDDALRSSDAKVVEAYLREHFKAVPNLPFSEWARQWTAMDWQSTTMTHCNFYHSLKLGAVLMGDAAHATSPSIGMGMNHALGDAAALDVLLDEHCDDLSTALPAYSEVRVKEGRALTDVADLIQSYDTRQNILMTLRQVARGIGHALLPSYIDPEPYVAIGNGMKLSEAYAILVRTGRLPAIRATNAAIKQRHFERTTGMVPPPAPSTRISTSMVAAIIALTAGAAALFVRTDLGSVATEAPLVSDGQPWWAQLRGRRV